MTKTSIQLPEALYREIKRVAAEHKMSRSKLVQRGLETLLSCFPVHPESHATWELPKLRPLGGDAFFDNPNWRYEINEGRGVVRRHLTRGR